MHVKQSILGALCFVTLCSCYKTEQVTGSKLLPVAADQTGAPLADTGLKVSMGANAWLTQAAPGGAEVVTDYGLANWTSARAVFSAFVRVSQPGSLQLSLRAKVPSGSSKIKITLPGKSVTVTASGSAYHTVPAGDFTIRDTGYVRIDFQGVSKTGGYFADVSDLYIGGTAVNGKVVYIKDDIYWARRGPSVHLGFTAPAGKDIAWFYNEITVQAGDDPIGSYYMANGFGEGYFGIQVNSATERRVLFSIWSPFNTDDPNSIPDSMKIKLLKKGPDVKTGEFGNEGAGGQSYLVYNWKNGTTYRFLTNARPDGQGNTVYTSWFYPPEEGRWRLIASFKRPKTNTYLKGLYSFLESFSPDKGYLGRKGQFGNQWVRDTNNSWQEITAARFTGDATAKAERRLDFAGGVEGKRFYLRNCGFLSRYVPLNTPLTRTASGQAPVIDFNALP